MVNLITSLIRAGVWNTLDLFLNFAYNNSADQQGYARINWLNPAGALVDLYGGLTFETAGFKGNGIDGYINTGCNPSQEIHYKLNDASRGAFVFYDENIVGSDNSRYHTIDCSLVDYGLPSPSANCMYVYNADVHRINSANNRSGNYIDLRGLGYKYIGRGNANNVILISKDAQYSDLIPSVKVENANQILIANSVVNVSFVGLSMYHLGANLTYNETQLIRTAYNNYLTAIGLDAI